MAIVTVAFNNAQNECISPACKKETYRILIMFYKGQNI